MEKSSQEKYGEQFQQVKATKEKKISSKSAKNKAKHNQGIAVSWNKSKMPLHCQIFFAHISLNWSTNQIIFVALESWVKLYNFHI